MRLLFFFLEKDTVSADDLHDLAGEMPCEVESALDPDRREVMVGDSPIVLTAREFDVLALLMTHAETVLTRERIAHEALGYEYVGDTNNVDVHIAHLRAKIEDAGGARIIQTVRGVGYVCRA